MSILVWIEIIAKILILIAGGLSKEEAVAKASIGFGIPENEIWKHGGF